MKTTTLSFLKMGLYAIMGLSVLLTSCSPEDGKDGIDGIDGKDGAQGPAGQDGNANVIASDWQTIQWDEGSLPNFGTMLIDVKDIDLEEFIATGGVVMVYLRFRQEGVFDEIVPLPFTDAETYFYFSIFSNESVSGVLLRATNPNDSIFVYEDTETFTVRYVLVPANVSEANELNLNNYKEASKILGL
ncbi:MAG: hypothetical protein ACE37L_14370 [Allomuricauda sp.]